MKRKMLRIPHPPPSPQVEKELFEVYNKWNNIIHFAVLLLSPGERMGEGYLITKGKRS
jgi:hypothetical protein